MNLPNKLTLVRIGLIPVFVALMLIEQSWAQFAAAGVFALASFTDFLDGYIARKQGIVTDFGKLMDPMADKLLVMSALIGMLHLGYVGVLAVIVLLGREFIIMSVRLVAAGKGTVVAADMLGKIKTVLQMFAIIILLIGGGLMLSRNQAWGWILTVGEALMWASVLMSVWSCVNYILKNREVFKP